MQYPDRVERTTFSSERQDVRNSTPLVIPLRNCSPRERADKSLVAVPAVGQPRTHPDNLSYGCLRCVGRFGFDSPEHSFRESTLAVAEGFGDNTQHRAGMPGLWTIVGRD